MGAPPTASSTTASSRATYERLAGVYEHLERLAFGRLLQRARTAHLERVPPRAHVLSLGEGDGRFLRDLISARPDVRVTVVDASPAMLERARRRVPRRAAAKRVRFVEADLRSYQPEPHGFDVVAAMFVLDQFTSRQREVWLPTYVRALRPGGQWLHADFAVSEDGWRRLRTELWLGLLYRFFRVTTGIAASSLDPIEPSLRSAGLEPVARRTWSHGLVEAVAFELGAARESPSL